MKMARFYVKGFENSSYFQTARLAGNVLSKKYDVQKYNNGNSRNNVKIVKVEKIFYSVSGSVSELFRIRNDMTRVAQIQNLAFFKTQKFFGNTVRLKFPFFN